MKNKRNWRFKTQTRFKKLLILLQSWKVIRTTKKKETTNYGRKTTNKKIMKATENRKQTKAGKNNKSKSNDKVNTIEIVIILN